MKEFEKIKIKKEALNSKNETLITFNCEFCNKEVQMRAVNVRKKEYLLCNSCQIKYSKSLRTPEQKAETHRKTVETCLERYGVVNGGSSEISKKKARETWTQNWGSPEKCFEIRSEKAHNTFLEKYKGSYNTPEILEKKVNTLIKNYGSVEKSYASRLEKMSETNKKNHHGVWNFQDEEWRKKANETMLSHWGVKSFAQNKTEWSKVLNFYGTLGGLSGSWFYDNKRFDSFWEIAFYICLQEDNIEFTYHPESSYIYTNDEGREALYRPDFLVNGVLYEIKGDQFFNKEGKPVDFRGNSWFNKLHYMESLGVHLITSQSIAIQTTLQIEDIKPYIEKALSLKGSPNKYSFIKSCKIVDSKRSQKTKPLYETEKRIKEKFSK